MSNPQQENELLKACKYYIALCERGEATMVDLNYFKRGIAELENKKSYPSRGYMGTMGPNFWFHKPEKLKRVNDLTAFHNRYINTFETEDENDTFYVLVMSKINEILEPDPKPYSRPDMWEAWQNALKDYGNPASSWSLFNKWIDSYSNITFPETKPAGSNLPVSQAILTKRELIAAMTLQGLLSNSDINQSAPIEIVHNATLYADELLKKLE